MFCPCLFVFICFQIVQMIKNWIKKKLKQIKYHLSSYYWLRVFFADMKDLKFNNLNSIQIKRHNIDERFILSANRSMIHMRYIYFKCLRRSRCYFHKCHTRKHEKIFQSKKFYCIGRDMLVDNFLTLEYWSRCEIWNFNIGYFVCIRFAFFV